MTKEELREKLMNANSLEEMIAFAKENGVELSEEKAKELYDMLHTEGELSDDALEGVAGGYSCLDFWKDIAKGVQKVGDFFTKTVPEAFRDATQGVDCPYCHSRNTAYSANTGKRYCGSCKMSWTE